jgi:hypothetical protein
MSLLAAAMALILSGSNTYALEIYLVHQKQVPLQRKLLNDITIKRNIN